jgi:hypothetical protein
VTCLPHRGQLFGKTRISYTPGESVSGDKNLITLCKESLTGNTVIFSSPIWRFSPNMTTAAPGYGKYSMDMVMAVTLLLKQELGLKVFRRGDTAIAVYWNRSGLTQEIKIQKGNTEANVSLWRSQTVLAISIEFFDSAQNKRHTYRGGSTVARPPASSSRAAHSRESQASPARERREQIILQRS